METIWKIVTPDDLAAWKAAGVMTGSDLDKADGFIHSSNGAMVKKVARLFFSDRGDCLLLRMVPGSWDRAVTWVPDEPEGKKPPTDGGWSSTTSTTDARTCSPPSPCQCPW